MRHLQVASDKNLVAVSGKSISRQILTVNVETFTVPAPERLSSGLTDHRTP
jgi:hypothetical protein